MRLRRSHLWTILTFIGILPASILPQPVLAAPAQLHPNLFALPATLFPAGGSVIRSGVESNSQLRIDQPSHFGLPPGVVGRRTGYYMDVYMDGSTGADGTTQHPYTSYLVSIFHTARQAQAAYELRWDYWFGETYYTTPSTPPITLRHTGAQALFHTLDAAQPRLAELMFQRNAILVEVFQQTGASPPTADQLHAFWQIAARLNAVAGKHPLGA